MKVRCPPLSRLSPSISRQRRAHLNRADLRLHSNNKFYLLCFLPKSQRSKKIHPSFHANIQKPGTPCSRFSSLSNQLQRSQIVPCLTPYPFHVEAQHQEEEEEVIIPIFSFSKSKLLSFNQQWIQVLLRSEALFRLFLTSSETTPVLHSVQHPSHLAKFVQCRVGLAASMSISLDKLYSGSVYRIRSSYNNQKNSQSLKLCSIFFARSALHCNAQHIPCFTAICMGF